MSAGIRFTTLPDATPPSAQVPPPPNGATAPKGPPSQPPTTITAMFNPMLGHMTGAYAARVSRDLSLCSRFDFNVYSYESEWSLGAEWWTRRRQPQPRDDSPIVPDLSTPTLPLVVVPTQPTQPVSSIADEIQGVVKARASTTTVQSFYTPSHLHHTNYDPGCVVDVGGANTQPSRQFGNKVQSFESCQTYKGHRD